ncbi:TOMM precursor leader peptide-binding protein [Streptantibioticus silvisoli]|uniref:TOMM leader peptide-binding protein n=1 Tax=Streptantibioticus silvisoli TaxID=2705255 RepID=A0ABT6VTF2_9ACTN|nr:TOMM precursor leader peptide-binding protein [Streptantibioticus silvisoli]MDI5961753.1 TOMM precursor leader peptide-binding protein [Streptantibioticus silvisoli]
MTVTYEKIADARPRIRRDILFTQTPGGVVFHNAHGGFNLSGRSAYRFASLIVPHLNGLHTVGEICGGLGEKQRAMVAELVSTLIARGFARDVPEGGDGLEALDEVVRERFAAQIGYVDHYAGEAGSRFARFRAARVAVLGRDAVAAWCVLSLVRNGSAAVAVPAGGRDPLLAQAVAEAAELTDTGCPVVVEELRFAGAEPTWQELAGFDVVVAAGGPRALLRLVEAGVPDGVELLPVWTFGRRAVVGPLTARAVPGCWSCAALRLGANAEQDAAALWSAASLGDPDASGEVTVTGPTAAMLGNMVGYEIFRLRTGAMAAESRGKVVVQDLDSLDVVSETLLPHPRCPHCRVADAPRPAPVELGDAPLPPRTGELADDGDAALAELETRGVLVAERAGVFAGYADDGWEQTPIKAGTVTVGSGAARRDVSAFDVHHVAGARLRALRAAAAVYAERAGGPATLPRDAGRPAVDPAAIGTATGVEVPDAALRHQVAAVSLLTGATAWLPAGAVAPFGAFNADLAWAPTSAGTGAGGTVPEAAARGLLGALAYRALTSAVAGRGEVRRVGPDTLDGDPELVFLVRSAKNLGLRLELLDLLDGDRPAPVVLARARDDRGGAWHWAVGSSVSWSGAAVEAMRDLLGAVQLERQDDGRPADTGDPLLADFAPGTLAVTGECGAGDDAAGGWAGLLERLRASRTDALLVERGSADLAAGGLRVVRVVLVSGRDCAR